MECLGKTEQSEFNKYTSYLFLNHQAYQGNTELNIIPKILLIPGILKGLEYYGY